MDEFEEFLNSLPGKLSDKKRDAILDYVEKMVMVNVKVVEVDHSWVVTETVEAYGLTLELDAHGDAVTVEFPRSAQVIEEWKA